MACEDYPCCGHGTNQWGLPDCPEVDSKGRSIWKCVECGKRLPHTASSSICLKCQRRMREQDDDHDHSMDY